MDEIISKEEVEKLMKIKGEVRGVSLKNHRDFIFEKNGPEALKKFEDTMAIIGYPLKYSDLREINFYPVGLEVVELLVARKIFNLSDKQIEEIGAFESRVSLLMKIFFHYFASIKMMSQKAPAMWKENYTTGSLRVGDWNDKEKYANVIIENFGLHPIHCVQLRGYISNVLKMVVGKDVTCEETECTFNGGNCHNFLLKW